MSYTNRKVHHDYFKRLDPAGIAVMREIENSMYPEELISRIVATPRNPHYRDRLDGEKYTDSALRLVRVMLNYRAYGQQVLRLGPMMQQAFADTSLEGITSEVFKMPYPAFYLDLPETQLRTYGGIATGMHSVGGAYISYNDEKKLLDVHIWGKPNKASRFGLDDASFWFTIDFGKVSKSGLSIENFLNDLISDHAPVVTHSAWSQVDPKIHNVSGEAREALVDALPEQKRTAIAVLRMAINTSLYASSPTADLVKVENPNEKKAAKLRKKISKADRSRKASRLQAKLDSLPSATVIHVGRAYETSASKARGGTVRSHWRKGHWHSYRTGKRIAPDGTKVPLDKQPLVMRWVEPVLVKPGGEPVRHTYVVEDLQMAEEQTQ